MMFILGLKFFAPIILIQLLLQLFLSFIQKSIPSLNVFVLSFSINFMVSMSVLFLFSYVILNAMGQHITTMERGLLDTLIRVLREN